MAQLKELSAREKPDRKPSLVVNAISNWAALGVNMVIGFLLTPYLIACLGTKNYGIWVLIVSVIGYYGVLDLGVRSAVMRYVARYAGVKDHKALNQVVNGAIAMFCGVAALVAISSFLGAEPLARFFHIEAEEFVSFKQVVVLLGISAGLMFPGSVLPVVIMAHERFVMANVLKIVSGILRGGLVFLVLSQGGTLVHISCIYLGLNVFEILINSLLIKVYFKHVTFSLKLIQIRFLIRLLNFGFFAFIGKLGNLLRLNLDCAIIGRFLAVEMVAVYGLAAFLFGVLYRLVAASVGVTQPRLSSLAGQVDSRALSKAVMRYSIIIANLVVCFGLTGVLLGRDFIKLFVPENFKDPDGAGLVLIILLVGLIPDLMTSVSVNALLAIKKHRFYAYQTIIEGIANVMLSIILIAPFGIYGVALGTAIPALVTKLIIQPIYCCRILQIGWWEYMSNVLLKPLLVFVGGVTLWYGSGVGFIAKTYPQLIFKGVVILSVYSIIAFRFCLDEESRQLIREKLRRFPAIMGAKAE